MVDLRHYEGDAELAAGVVDGDALAKARVGAKDEGEVGELRRADRALEHVDPDILVQVREAVARDDCAVLAHVGLGAVKLGAEVGELDRAGIVKSE